MATCQKTSRSFETFCNLSWTSLSLISPSLTLVDSFLNNNSWNYKSPSIFLKLVAILITKAIAWSTFIGFEKPWHLFSHITKSSLNSFALIKKHSLLLFATYKDFFISTKLLSNVCTKAYISDFILSKFSFIGGRYALSFSALSKSLFTNANFFSRKTLTCLEYSIITQSSLVRSSLLGPCLEEKDPQLIPLLVMDGGLLAFFICSWLLSQAYKAKSIGWALLWANHPFKNLPK